MRGVRSVAVHVGREIVTSQVARFPIHLALRGRRVHAPRTLQVAEVGRIYDQPERPRQHGGALRQVVILGEAKILDLERDRLGRRVRIEVLSEVEEHVALRLVQRLQHSFQVPMDLDFGIDGGKEITKGSSCQHVTFTIAWKIAGIPAVNFTEKGASYLPMRSRPPMNGRKASGMITEPSAC